MEINPTLTDEERSTTANSSLAKWRLTCFYDSFVLNQSAELRLNICAKIRHFAKLQTVTGKRRTTRLDNKNQI
jgi:hypothetical protein